MPLDSITLKCFLYIVETGSVTKAAEHIGRTQSAVSQQITRLETLLGKTLFNRENGFSLTHYGDVFYSYAKKIYHLQCESIDRLNGIDLEHEIKIGLPEDFASSVLSRVLSRFSQAYPYINLNVECDLNNKIFERFQQNEFDLCLIKELNRHKIPNDVIIYQDELLWIGTEEFIDQGKEDAIVPLILSPQASIYRDLALKTLNEAQIKWRIIFSSRSYTSKIEAAISGLGVTVMQKSLIPPEANLTIISNLPPLGVVNLYILQHKSTPATKYLVKLLTHLTHGLLPHN